MNKSGKRKEPVFPMQPLCWDNGGVLRFMENRIVRDLLDLATYEKIMDLNTIAIDAAKGRYTKAEQRQFAQLIGYSVSGYGDLTQYVSTEQAKKADSIKRPSKSKVWP